MRLERIVIGVDFSASSIDAIRWTVSRFAPDAEFLLVHAVEPPPPADWPIERFPSTEELLATAHGHSEHALQHLARTLRDQRVRTEVRVGPPHEEIVAAAIEHGADVIVVGRHRQREGWWNVGSTAERLVGVSPIPILLAGGEGGSERERILVVTDAADGAPTVLEWTRLLATRFDGDVTVQHVSGQVGDVLRRAPCPTLVLTELRQPVSSAAPWSQPATSTAH